MRTLRGLRRLLRVAVIGLFVAAVATELSKPEDQRTWHGRVGGVVPYDFRPPTWERIRAAYWNPESVGGPPSLSIRMSTREPSAGRSRKGAAEDD